MPHTRSAAGRESLPLAGRTAVVTGSGRNIGRAVALLFARMGANVVTNGLSDREAAERVAAEARELGAGAEAVMADVGDPAQARALCERARDRFGAVDILVSNVAVRLRQPFLDISVDEWRRVIETNLSSAFYLARAVLPGMVERRWGRIIHISGHDGFLGAVNRAHNVTCKAGLHGLTKALALEFGPYGVTVNTVTPGVIDTTRDPRNYPDYEQRYVEIAGELPVRRIGVPEDIAHACLYLASNTSGFITGQAIHLTGGEIIP